MTCRSCPAKRAELPETLSIREKFCSVSLSTAESKRAVVAAASGRSCSGRWPRGRF